MSAAAVMAFVAGVCAVLAAWEALEALDGRVTARTLGWVLAPLRARREPTVRERRRLALVATGTLCASGWLLAGPVTAALLAAAGPLAVGQALRLRARRRRAELARASPAVARALADALGAGHAVSGAIGAAAADGALAGAPGGELAQAAAELALGTPTPVVVEGLRRRAGDPAWDTLAAAILLQRDAGGDLAGLLRGLAERLEDARRADADARSATAQARTTAWIVGALPAAAAVLAELGAPGFVAGMLRTPLTAALVAASFVLQLAALCAVARIARTHA